MRLESLFVEEFELRSRWGDVTPNGKNQRQHSQLTESNVDYTPRQGRWRDVNLGQYDDNQNTDQQRDTYYRLHPARSCSSRHKKHHQLTSVTVTPKHPQPTINPGLAPQELL
jgi:hypothetical protein